MHILRTNLLQQPSPLLGLKINSCPSHSYHIPTQQLSHIAYLFLSKIELEEIDDPLTHLLESIVGVSRMRKILPHTQGFLGRLTYEKMPVVKLVIIVPEAREEKLQLNRCSRLPGLNGALS